MQFIHIDKDDMKIWELIKKYKWLIAIIIFIAYMFFGDAGIPQHRKLNKEIRQLKSELKHQQDIIAELQEQNKRLIQQSGDNKEEFLRTHLYLKKDDEDVFRVTQMEEE